MNFKLAITLLFVGIGQCLISQNIDFEQPELNEGDIFQGACPNGDEGCCVTMFLGTGHDDFTPSGYPVIAEVGGVSSSAAFNVDNHNSRTSPECGILSPTKRDMPLPGQDNGCKFITGIIGFEEINTIRPLVIDYDSPTHQASGEIIDIDGGEIWEILAFKNSGGTFTEVYRSYLNSSSPGAGDGLSTYFEINSLQTFDRVVIQYSPTSTRTTTIGLAFDNFRACSLNPLKSQCCDNATTISQIGFYEQFPYFSEYTKNNQGIKPGEYGFVMTDESTDACAIWNEQISDCGINDNIIFVVNGLTNRNSGSNSVVFEHPENNVVPGRYNYCFDAKRLQTCCFDNFPPHLTIEVLDGNGTIISSNEIDIDTDPGNPCDWMTPSISFSVTNTTNLTFRYRLDESRRQDGNDFALDNLTLKKKNNMPSNAAKWTFLSQTPISYGGQSGVITTADFDNNINFTADCSYLWRIYRLDNQGNRINSSVEFGDASRGWPLNNNTFHGYNGRAGQGFFPDDVSHEIVLTVECPCLGSDDGTNPIHKTKMAKEPEDDGFRDKPYQSSLKDLKIFPNPSQGSINLSFTYKDDRNYIISIKDMKGKIIEQIKEVKSGEMLIELDNLSKGMYLLSIQSDEDEVEKKFILE